jgi:hypothetical protein
VRSLTCNNSLLQWFVAALCLEVLDCSDDAFAVDDFAEDDMLLVEMWCQNGSDEELRAIGAYLHVSSIQPQGQT